jgi:hypothetical protein
MRLPQVLVYETDGRLASLLRETAQARRLTVREPRQPEACLRLLRRGPGVLVLKLGRDPGPELLLLERVSWLCPEAATVVVGDEEHRPLAAVAWDLGAAYVLLPPQGRDVLPAVVAGLLALPAAQPDLLPPEAAPHE